MPIHRVAYRVYYEDTDAMGVMYHAQYLAFAERGRSEALRAAGATVNEMVRQHGCGFVVRSVTLDCLRPVVLDDLLTVATELDELGSASVRLSQKLERGEGEIVADMDVTLVCVRQDGRPTRIPERWRDVLAGLAASR